MKRLLTFSLAAVAIVATVFVATASAKTIHGTAKAEVLRGTASADKIYGGAGNDRLYGLGGNDYFYPGAGVDMVYCGAGIDQGGEGLRDRPPAEDRDSAAAHDGVAHRREQARLPGVPAEQRR